MHSDYYTSMKDSSRDIVSLYCSVGGLDYRFAVENLECRLLCWLSKMLIHFCWLLKAAVGNVGKEEEKKAEWENGFGQEDL